MAYFKKPFRAVPLKPKRLRGLDEFDQPLWQPPTTNPAINWGMVAIGLLIGACLGFAYILASGWGI
ncbi:MAG: hypothetical protein WA842_03090 [Croceibacterium sp.]